MFRLRVRLRVNESRGDFGTVGQIPRSAGCYPASIMEVKGLTPRLNASDIASTVAWFERWGWKKLWDWGTPPTFGAVGSGKETCIFLCRGRREAAAAARTPPRFSMKGEAGWKCNCRESTCGPTPITPRFVAFYNFWPKQRKIAGLCPAVSSRARRGIPGLHNAGKHPDSSLLGRTIQRFRILARPALQW
jgi:hypothetical protein